MKKYLYELCGIIAGMALAIIIALIVRAQYPDAGGTAAFILGFILGPVGGWIGEDFYHKELIRGK